MSKSDTTNKTDHLNTAIKVLGLVLLSVLTVAVVVWLIFFIINQANNSSAPSTDTPTSSSTSATTPTPTSGNNNSTSNTASDGRIANPNPRVKVNGNLVSVEGLEFYVPYHFT